MRELNTDYLGNTTVGTDGKWYIGAGNAKEIQVSSSVRNYGYMPTKLLNQNSHRRDLLWYHLSLQFSHSQESSAQNL